MNIKTSIAVAPEPRPSAYIDVITFIDLLNVKETYNYFLRNDQRWGQAFMNILPMEYYNILSGSLVDPFYRDDVESICKALDYLLDRI